MITAFGCIDIIVRRDSLEKVEKGLAEKLIREYGINDCHYDEYIICIPGGMNPYDVQIEVAKLEKEYRLIFNPNQAQMTDMVIVEGLLGVRTKNNWLKPVKGDSGEKIIPFQYVFDETV